MTDNIDKKFPYEIKKLTPEENKEIGDIMKGMSHVEYIRIGPKGHLLATTYNPSLIYNFPVRSDDIFVASFPKSGTTWTQELVWLLKNDLDYENAKSIKLDERFPFLEATLMAPRKKDDPMYKALWLYSVEDIKQLPSPRLIKTHLAISLLPPNILDTTKVVYVARDPRDVAVSYYHQHIMMKFLPVNAEFKAFWKMFIENKVAWGSYFGTVLEAWEKRNHPNMLFLFYEELSKDLPAAIRRVAKFLGKELTDQQVAELNEHLTFDNFKKNKSVNLTDLHKNGVLEEGYGFIRKGKVGGWRNQFDEEMTKEAEKWIVDNLRGTDFRFSHF